MCWHLNVGISLKSKCGGSEMFAARRARDAATFKNRLAVQATNRPEGSVMERNSEIAARSAEFLSRVLPFSLIVVAAVDSVVHGDHTARDPTDHLRAGELTR